MKESNFLSQICANLDSVIVSTKNFAPVLQKVVPKPKKQYDIAEKRALVLSSVCLSHNVIVLYNCLNIQDQYVCMFVCNRIHLATT